ncbi:helix-hairpin-helix domain-containing protein [Bacillus sp. 03113]|uniref:helix-hairpin-helix domain-containing protein n=1 Tax=Bacillus sp. 03113 TaxID=2578211 RepID=UPI00215D4160|nr:helix-hairpin-helix domain-containing protein [Bacillus sp. 03113]
MKENKTKIIIGFIGTIILLYVYFSYVKKEQPIVNEEMAQDLGEKKRMTNENKEPLNTTMMVDVKGAVQHPGIFEAKPGDRVMDIITKAGGLRENANKDSVNFALKVVDEMVIYIPEIGEVQEQQITSIENPGNVQDGSGKVNLNKANEEELQTIPGIGPSKAAAIIEYRESNGPFKKIEDLQSISGIGEKTFEKLKDHITVQ